MSADNAVARAQRESETAEHDGGFAIPADIGARYEVRAIETARGSSQRIGFFASGTSSRPAIEITGERIVARTETPETIASLIKLATHNRWEGIEVEGSPDFRRAIWFAGTRTGFDVRGYEPDFAEAERVQRVRHSDAARDARDADGLAPAADQEQATMHKAGDASTARSVRDHAAASPGPDHRTGPHKGSVGRSAAEAERLAELFLHGSAEAHAEEPRLTSAIKAQAVMERYLAELFKDDAPRVAEANLESRQMISDVLRRGLDVSVREPAPVRKMEPVHTPEIER